jgi:hypothetical protein
MANSFYKGESVLFSIEVRDQSTNVLVDPTTMSITISKPPMKTTDSTLIKADTTMTKVSVGKYSFSWLSDEVGNYMVTYKANNNSNITISKDSFIVIN